MWSQTHCFPLRSKFCLCPMDINASYCRKDSAKCDTPCWGQNARQSIKWRSSRSVWGLSMCGPPMALCLVLVKGSRGSGDKAAQGPCVHPARTHSCWRELKPLRGIPACSGPTAHLNLHPRVTQRPAGQGLSGDRSPYSLPSKIQRQPHWQSLQPCLPW